MGNALSQQGLHCLLDTTVYVDTTLIGKRILWALKLHNGAGWGKNIRKKMFVVLMILGWGELCVKKDKNILENSYPVSIFESGPPLTH